MAVEIPVVVDIMGGIEGAVSQIPTAMRKAQQTMSQNALKIEVQLDAKGAKATVEDFVKGANTNITQLGKAITQIKKEMSSLALSGNGVSSNERFTALNEALTNLIAIKKEVTAIISEGVKADEQSRKTAVSLKEQEQELINIQNTLRGAEVKVQAINEQLAVTKFDDANFNNLAVKARQAADELRFANEMIAELGMKKGSIEQLALSLGQVAEQWRAMGSEQMFDKNGNLTKEAMRVQTEYTKITQKLEKQKNLLNEQIESQRQAAAAAKKREEEEERILQKMIEEEEAEKKRQALLVQTSRTLSELNAQIAAWQGELANAQFGSVAFDNAVKNAAILEEKLAAINAQIKILGANNGSINQLQAKLAEINRQYNALGPSNRMGDAGQKLLDEYRKISTELQKEGQSLQQIIQKEEQAAAAAKKREEAVAKIQSKRKVDDALLSTMAKNLKTLQSQATILQERMSRANFGSEQFAKLKSQLDVVNAKIRQVTGEAERMNTTFGRSGGIVSQLTGYFSGLYGVMMLVRFVKNIRDVTASLEYQRVALGRLLQDEQMGNELFERIKAAAVESPFRIKELVTYTKQLAAYRIETSKLFETTQRLADISAGLGVDMNRLILAYGQVRAASVLRGQELRQFTEAGIPLVELLAEKFTELNGRATTTADVFKLISERAVPFEYIEEIFQDLTDEGGMFFEMQEKQAATLQGRWEKLKDQYDNALQDIGDTDTFQRANDIILDGLNLIANNLRLVPKLLNGVTFGWLAYNAALLLTGNNIKKAAAAEVQLTAAERLRIKNIPGLTVSIFGQATAEKILTKALINQRLATNALSRGFWSLTAAMMSNPVGFIVGAITTLITLFTTFRKKVKDVNEEIQSLDSTIEENGRILSSGNRMDKLIDRYERLATKTNRSAKENQTLASTMITLQKAFHNVKLELDNQANSIPAQVAGLKKMNKQQQENAIATLKQAKANIELRLSQVEPKQSAITGRWLEASRTLQALEDSTPLKDRKGKTWRNMKKQEAEVEKQAKEMEEVNEEVNSLYRRLTSIDEILNPTPVITDADDDGKDRLSKLRQQITDLTNAYKKYLDLLKYEGKDAALKDIAIAYPQLEGFEPTMENTLDRLNGMLDKYAKDVDATRLIKQAISNINFDALKTTLSDKMKQLSDDLKRSETARKLFEDILSATGDEGLATSLTVSVYGDIGKDFRGRMQEELSRAMQDVENPTEELQKAVQQLDFNTILKYLDKFPDAWQTELKKMAEESAKYNADEIREWTKVLDKYQSYAAKRVQLAKQTSQEIAEINASNIPQDKKGELIGAYTAKESREANKLEYEAFKDTPLYTEMFEDLGSASERALDNMRNRLRTLKDSLKSLDPSDLKEISSRIEEVEEAFSKTNPIKLISEGIREYRELGGRKGQKAADENLEKTSVTAMQEQSTLSLVMEQYSAAKAAYESAKAAYEQSGTEADRQGVQLAKDKLGLEEHRLKNQQQITEQAQEESESAEKTSTSFKQALSKIKEGMDGMQSVVASVRNIVGSLQDAYGYATDIFDLNESDEINGMFEALNSMLPLLEALIVAQIAFNAAANLNPYVLIATAIIASLTAIAGLISGIGNAKNNRLQKKIDKLQESVDSLTEAYEKLADAEDEALGSDYSMNIAQQKEMLQAQLDASRQQLAYAEQMTTSTKKQRKQREEAIEEATEQIRDLESQLADMNGKLAEFYTGTDVTSAATAFAEAWIDAYTSFSSTSGAIKDKFNEMIQDMVVNSVMAQAVQSILKPLFDEIDRMATEDSGLTPEDISYIAAMTTEKTAEIDESLTALAERLRAAGFNMRAAGSTMTGISKEISGASEESIQGLAAGVNTQNYYMSYMPTISANVSAILAILGGGTETQATDAVRAAQSATAASTFGDDTFRGQMSRLDENVAAMYYLLKSVVTPKAANVNTHCVGVKSY